MSYVPPFKAALAFRRRIFPPLADGNRLCSLIIKIKKQPGGPGAFSESGLPNVNPVKLIYDRSGYGFHGSGGIGRFGLFFFFFAHT